MSAPVFHRFDAHGAVCGVVRGINAADFDPPEITCRRCRRVGAQWWERQTVCRDGSIFLSEAAG